MRKSVLVALVLAMAGTVGAAPNVTNATQKGSLLIFPDVRVHADNVAAGWETLVRIQNDGGQDVDVLCYWMDGNKNRVDFIIPVTRYQAVWFDARTGRGTYQVNRFPFTKSNGFDNPYLTILDEATDDAEPYFRGLLACWTVDAGAQNQVKWNHLSGTATVYDSAAVSIGGYEYNAYAFFVPTGLDLEPVGVAGSLGLTGVEYDACPLYQIGQFTPAGTAFNQAMPLVTGVKEIRLAIATCTLSLNQDWTPVYTKLQFDVWNEDEVKFTGAFECADSWHETQFQNVAPLAQGGPFDAAVQNFAAETLGTPSARYRVQGVASTQCPGSQAAGVVAVQSLVGTLSEVPPRVAIVGTTLAAAGKFTGRIAWDPEGPVPEGGVR